MNIKYITCRCNCQSGRPIKFVFSYLNHLTVKILMITWTCISEARVMSRKKNNNKKQKKKKKKKKKTWFSWKNKKTQNNNKCGLGKAFYQALFSDMVVEYS